MRKKKSTDRSRCCDSERLNHPSESPAFLRAFPPQKGQHFILSQIACLRPANSSGLPLQILEKSSPHSMHWKWRYAATTASVTLSHLLPYLIPHLKIPRKLFSSSCATLEDARILYKAITPDKLK